MDYSPIQQGLHGKIVIVTGGASGIGAAVAECMRASGAIVECFDIGTQKDRAQHRPVDVSDSDSVQKATSAVIDQHGRCDIVVNTAGVHASGTVQDIDDATWERLFAINVSGVRNVCRAVLPHMTSGSAIVNVSSAAGLRPNAEMAAYVASKSAVVGLTKALAVDHAEQGIRVNCVCPGLVDTPMLQHSYNERSQHDLKTVTSFANYLVKRSAVPAEMAAAICFLASDSAQYITGSTLAVDGGRSLY